MWLCRKPACCNAGVLCKPCWAPCCAPFPAPSWVFARVCHKTRRCVSPGSPCILPVPPTWQLWGRMMLPGTLKLGGRSCRTCISLDVAGLLCWDFYNKQIRGGVKDHFSDPKTQNSRNILHQLLLCGKSCLGIRAWMETCIYHFEAVLAFRCCDCSASKEIGVLIMCAALSYCCQAWHHHYPHGNAWTDFFLCMIMPSLDFDALAVLFLKPGTLAVQGEHAKNCLATEIWAVALAVGSFSNGVQVLSFHSVPMQVGGQKDGCCGWAQFCSVGCVAGWGGMLYYHTRFLLKLEF